MWRRRLPRPAIGAVVVSAVVAAMLAGCTLREQEQVGTAVEAARGFDGFPLYWVGERFEKWDLRAVELPAPRTHGLAALVYGHCEPVDPDGFFGHEGGSCTPPLVLQISPLCSHLDAVVERTRAQRQTIRGAPVRGSASSGPILLTRGVQVKADRGQGSDPGLAYRALRALRSLNGVAPVVAPGASIPAPHPLVLAGSRPCSDTRPGLTLIDESEGTYRGVGIGDSPEEVRRVLGARPFARPDEPLSPTSTRSYADLGGPTTLNPPCRPAAPRAGRPPRLQVLRYPDVSFAFCEGRAFAVVVAAKRARTQAGVAVGDQLADVRMRYPHVRCGRASSGDSGGYPCVGGVRPRRSLWFGHDPGRQHHHLRQPVQRRRRAVAADARAPQSAPRECGGQRREYAPVVAGVPVASCSGLHAELDGKSRRCLLVNVATRPSSRTLCSSTPGSRPLSRRHPRARHR